MRFSIQCIKFKRDNPLGHLSKCMKLLEMSEFMERLRSLPSHSTHSSRTELRMFIWKLHLHRGWHTFSTGCQWKPSVNFPRSWVEFSFILLWGQHGGSGSKVPVTNAPCSSLQGDSGGPLVCEQPGGQWTLFGLTSWGSVCFSKVLGPGVYSNVSYFVKWIKREIYIQTFLLN